jgi:hypothetical protein
MPFRETIAVYCENHMEHMNTLCGQNAEFSSYLTGNALRLANQLMLFRETMAIYCENDMEHIDAPCGQNAEFLNVKSGVHIQCVQPWRKWDLQRRLGATFLCNYHAIPCWRECSCSLIPSRQFLYMHTYIRVLYKDVSRDSAVGIATGYGLDD